jgi:hypothetical protein
MTQPRDSAGGTGRPGHRRPAGVDRPTLLLIKGLIANRMGVVATDLHCLHALHRDGPTTASALAGRVSLTRGRFRGSTGSPTRAASSGYPTRRPATGPHRADDRGPGPHHRLRRRPDRARTREDLTALGEDQLRTLPRFLEVTRDNATAAGSQLGVTLRDGWRPVESGASGHAADIRHPSLPSGGCRNNHGWVVARQRRGRPRRPPGAGSLGQVDHPLRGTTGPPGCRCRCAAIRRSGPGRAGPGSSGPVAAVGGCLPWPA